MSEPGSATMRAMTLQLRRPPSHALCLLARLLCSDEQHGRPEIALCGPRVKRNGCVVVVVGWGLLVPTAHAKAILLMQYVVQAPRLGSGDEQPHSFWLGMLPSDITKPTSLIMLVLQRSHPSPPLRDEELTATADQGDEPLSDGDVGTGENELEALQHLPADERRKALRWEPG